MKILVTGGCGFIGTHLVNKLVELGHEVVVLDNLSAGKKEKLNEKSTLVQGDIRDADDVRRAMKDCSAVFHLAAFADARSASDDLVYATNFLGAKNVFEIARSKNAKIIFTSSAAVYGNTQVPNRESIDCNPVSQYGKSKLRAERYLMREFPQESYFIVRLFNVYGTAGNSAVNRFCKKITNYEDIVVYGNGLQTRDYVYITDVIDALVLGLTNSGWYNVGTGQDISTLSLIETIHNMTRCKPSIKFTAPNPGEIGRSRADITKIKGLGWSPKVGLQDGIQLVLDSIGFKMLV
jgi:nucleoside-diphosphate-sugar epimerase